MISIIIPVYGDGNMLPHIVSRIDTVLRKNKSETYEIVLVDDASPLNAFEVIKTLSAVYPNITGIELAKNAGQQNATYCGMHFAKGDIIVTIDDDLQHEPELIPVLISRLSETTDLVYGVFTARQDEKHRRWGSKLTGKFFKSRFKVLRGNRVSSFRAFNKELSDKVTKSEHGFVYLSCLLLSKCCGVANVHIPFQPKQGGQSRYTLTKLISVFLKLHLNYGFAGAFYRKYLKKHTSCFEIKEIVYSSVTTDQEVYGHESNDAWGRYQSAVCN